MNKAEKNPTRLKLKNADGLGTKIVLGCLCLVSLSVSLLLLSLLLSRMSLSFYFPFLSNDVYLCLLFCDSFSFLFLSFYFFVVFLSLSFGYHTISELEVLIICRMNGRQKWPNRFLKLSESHQVKTEKNCMYGIKENNQLLSSLVYNDLKHFS